MQKNNGAASEIDQLSQFNLCTQPSLLIIIYFALVKVIIIYFAIKYFNNLQKNVYTCL